MWGAQRNKLGKKARPVAPVFQPETAARDIYRASQRRVHEVWLGSSSIQSIAGNMLFPALFDRLLAKKARGGQTEEQPPITWMRRLMTCIMRSAALAMRPKHIR